MLGFKKYFLRSHDKLRWISFVIVLIKMEDLNHALLVNSQINGHDQFLPASWECLWEKGYENFK